MARLGFISQSALRRHEKYAEWDAEQQFEVPGVRVDRSQSRTMWKVLKAC